jgi:hypothetical protein
MTEIPRKLEKALKQVEFALSEANSCIPWTLKHINDSKDWKELLVNYLVLSSIDFAQAALELSEAIDCAPKASNLEILKFWVRQLEDLKLLEDFEEITK